MDYKITKIQKYGVYSSEKIGTQWYFTVFARLYPKTGGFYKVHYLCYFDAEDLDEYINSAYYDGDPDVAYRNSYTPQDIKNYRNEVVFGMSESVFSGEDINTIVDNCNYYINRYK